MPEDRCSVKDEIEKDKAMKISIATAAVVLLILAGLSGCSSQTIIPPEDLALAAGGQAPARTIGYQDPIRWPQWDWWQSLTSTHPKRWDVVVFRPDPQKAELRALRVVGLPGEDLRFEDGRVLANGQPVAVPEALKSIRYAPGSFSVPPESYFLLSDDPRQANDSRQIGAVQRSAIRSRIDSVGAGK